METNEKCHWYMQALAHVPRLHWKRIITHYICKNPNTHKNDWARIWFDLTLIVWLFIQIKDCWTLQVKNYVKYSSYKTRDFPTNELISCMENLELENDELYK